MASAGVASAQDVVVTTNGDRLVGEIKNVGKDVLTLSPPYSDVDFKIKWEDVVSIQSQRQFIVETFDGKRLSGSLTPSPDKKVQIGATTVPLSEVSTVQPFEMKFWSRFESGLDFGYSMTRANSATQLSLGSNLSYRDEHHGDTLFANVFRSSQDNAPTTQRWDLSNDFRRLIGAKWYVNTTQDFLNSEEQGLDLRTTIGGGAGLYLMRTSSQHLATGAGIAWTNENYTDDTVPTKNSAEAYFGTEFMTEKLKVTDFITRFTYLSEPDDLRPAANRLPVRLRLQSAGRLVFADRVLRQLRQQAAGGIFQERLRVVERVRVQVLTRFAVEVTFSDLSGVAARNRSLRPLAFRSVAGRTSPTRLGNQTCLRTRARTARSLRSGFVPRCRGTPIQSPNVTSTANRNRHFRVACSASDSPDCERADGDSLKNGAQGGDRRLGDRDPT